ncbi:54S ribosomal protein, mitochondrial [Ascosphaera atra]|nr:54S ribosomal protein, mitochondrial [Ascosphaera atra]
MSGSKALGAMRWLSRSSTGVINSFEPSLSTLPSYAVRSMATETDLPSEPSSPQALPEGGIPLPTWTPPTVQAIMYKFANMEPKEFVEYEQKQLGLPLRRDLLHKAVVFEGNSTRQGTASTKWRDDVHGSGRKLRPQKGTGQARLSDKKSPSLRGGGVAHGPHPRDFSTGMPKKMYDLAWRTALSYRFKRGQLIIVDKIAFSKQASPMKLKNMFDAENWGKKFGRSMLITDVVRDKLWEAVAEFPQTAIAKDVEDVDVKDLLETGRLVVEKAALDRIFARHQRDLRMHVPNALDVAGIV